MRRSLARLGVRLAAALAILGATALPAAAQQTHLLVIVGVGGSPDHVKRFHGYGTTIVDSAVKGGLPEAQITYLADKPEEAPAADARSTRENVSKALSDLAAGSGANDEIFIVLIGHGTFDGQQGAFNLGGPDLTAADYATLLGAFKTQRIVFVNTASSSGAFLSALAGPARTIVTATRTGGERNETRFAEHFAAAWNTESADSDRNGRISVQEAFEYARLNVEASYKQTGHIPTEHPTLDDGSDGKLASTQYLTPPRSRSGEMASADPKLQKLVAQQDELQQQIDRHRLMKDRMDAAQYEAELERLLTELALVSRTIRDMEGAR
ncbi:MAG: C13 family peptidase [Vicinamibacterales bacterium]